VTIINGMAEYFTRATWRRGKKHPWCKRTKPYGGCKTAPPELLEAGKATRFGSGIHRICSATTRAGHPCGNIALKDMKACGYHGGYGQWARQGKLIQTGRAKAIKAQNPKTSPTNPQLILIPQYQQASPWDRIRLAKAWQTPAWPHLIKTLKQRDIAACV
jgi:hypothetical protein